MLDMFVWTRKHAQAFVHPALRSFVLRHVSLLDSRTRWWISNNPYLRDAPRSTYATRYPVVLGILTEFWHRHTPYIAACRELGAAYRVIDITAEDWMPAIRQSGCDAFLVHPSVQVSMWKDLFDERLRTLVEDLGQTIFPSYEELWLYENKRRMAYWLQAHAVPHARTWIFYDRQRALDFAGREPLPLVSKTSMGARASGVVVHRDRRTLVKYIKRAFSRGIVHADGEARDADWRFVILQEYVPDAKEWRIIRIGDSFFGYRKGRRGDFHSGTLLKSWDRPPDTLLDFVHHLTDAHGFKSIALDILEDDKGQLYVNELQSLFGASLPYQMKIDDKTGRMLRTDEGRWTFEEGDFCRNQCYNLRVQALLDLLQRRREGHEDPVRP